jgi:hypothetical protein
MVETKRNTKLLCLDHRGDKELMALVMVESRLEVDGWIGWFFFVVGSEEEKRHHMLG